MSDKNIIGDRLYELRTNKHLTISELSKLIDVSNGHISELESGKSMPTIQTLIKFCDFYKINLIGFFTDTNTPLKITRKQLEFLRLLDNMTDEQVEYLKKFIKSITKGMT